MSGGRWHHTHLIVAEQNGVLKGACGETSSILKRFNLEGPPSAIMARGPMCPDCAKFYWSVMCGSMPIKLTLENVPNDPKGSGYDTPRQHLSSSRSLWRVMRDGKQIAWIFLVPGWGKGWKVCGHYIGPRDRDNENVTEADVLPGYEVREENFEARDAALYYLSGVLALGDQRARNSNVMPIDAFVQRHAKSVVRRREDAVTDAARNARYKIEAEDRRKRETTELSLADLQLRDLAARGDLTNYQRAGLEWALKKLDIDVTEPSEQG